MKDLGIQSKCVLCHLPPAKMAKELVFCIFSVLPVILLFKMKVQRSVYAYNRLINKLPQTIHQIVSYINL